MRYKKSMWFSTPYYGEYIDCPLVGPDVSPHSWGADSTYLNGGGFAVNSRGSHRQYSFEWRGTSSLKSVDKIQKFRDGWYSRDSRDLYYFIDPLTINANRLPKRWAQPSILLENSVTGYVDTSMGRMSAGATPSLGHMGLKRVILSAPTSSPSRLGGRALFIPYTPTGSGIPNHFIHFVGSPLSSGAGLFYKEVTRTGISGVEQLATYADSTWTISPGVVSEPTTGVMIYFKGEVELFVGFTTETSSFSEQDMTSGMGNSGCRFLGSPTIIGNSAVLGEDGHFGYSVILKEVGDWIQ